jgi:hypothetical protein
VNLYCGRHRENHDLRPSIVEQVVYSLSAAYADAITEPEGGAAYAGEDALRLIPCPVEVARWAGDSEMYAEHVEQSVECRRAHERKARP